jgi:hypothetical protein
VTITQEEFNEKMDALDRSNPLPSHALALRSEGYTVTPRGTLADKAMAELRTEMIALRAEMRSAGEALGRIESHTHGVKDLVMGVGAIVVIVCILAFVWLAA